jgi:hypothetical protein
VEMFVLTLESVHLLFYLYKLLACKLIRLVFDIRAFPQLNLVRVIHRILWNFWFLKHWVTFRIWILLLRRFLDFRFLHMHRWDLGFGAGICIEYWNGYILSNSYIWLLRVDLSTCNLVIVIKRNGCSRFWNQYFISVHVCLSRYHAIIVIINYRGVIKSIIIFKLMIAIFGLLDMNIWVLPYAWNSSSKFNLSLIVIRSLLSIHFLSIDCHVNDIFISWDRGLFFLLWI